MDLAINVSDPIAGTALSSIDQPFNNILTLCFALTVLPAEAYSARNREDGVNVQAPRRGRGGDDRERDRDGRRRPGPVERGVVIERPPGRYGLRPRVGQAPVNDPRDEYDGAGDDGREVVDGLARAVNGGHTPVRSELAYLDMKVRHPLYHFHSFLLLD